MFGANIGRTITGWLAALLGFKLDLSHYLLRLAKQYPHSEAIAPEPFAPSDFAYSGSVYLDSIRLRISLRVSEG